MVFKGIIEIESGRFYTGFGGKGEYSSIP